MPDDRTIGQIGFDAYGETAGWKTFDGRPMPRWEDLASRPEGIETRRRWEVTAAAILKVVAEEPRESCVWGSK